MTDLGALPAPDQPIGQEPVQLDTPVRNMQELRQLDQSYQVSQEFDSAAKKGDWETANQRWDQMRQMGGIATLDVMAEGGDPARETRPVGAFLHPNLEMARRYLAFKDRQDQYDTFMRDDPELNEVRGYMQGVMAEYREMNDAELGAWQPSLMTPEQRMDYMAKLQPVRRDPNEVAEMRSRMVSIDNRMKQIDPSFSLWSDRKTGQWANWLNREAGVTGLGYLQSGEQELQLGVLGRVAQVGAEGIEAVTDPLLSAGYQVWEWTDQAMRSMGLPSISPPVNYIEGPGGEIYYNQERPHPGFLDMAQGMWSSAMGRDVIRDVAHLNRERQLEQAQRRGLNSLIHGTAQIAGTFLGFGLPAGAVIGTGAAAFSTSAKKGLSYLAGLGVKGAESARAAAFISTWAPRLGGAAGLGAFQATAFGKQQGYVNQYLTGMAMFPALAVLGHYGPRLERAMKRAKMPPKVAQMLSEGMVMGIPFATLEWAETGLWQHLRDPNQSTFQIYAKNILGAMLFKGAFGGKATSLQQEALQAARFHVERSHARAALAEEVAVGRADEAAAVGKFENLEPGDLKQLGETILRKKAAEDPIERSQIEQEQRSIEEQLDVKEHGLEPKIGRELEQIAAEEAGERPERPAPEFVEGAEPRIIEERGPGAERRKAERRAKEKARREAERLDPLEEIDYLDRPVAERKLIDAAADAAERKRIAATLEAGAERYMVTPDRPSGLWKVIDTRTGEAAMTAMSSRKLAEQWAEARAKEIPPERRVAERRKAEEPAPTEELQAIVREAPLGSQTVEGFRLEGVEGARRTALGDIFAEMGGRLARPGIRIPLTPIRIFGRAGDPVRPAFRKGRIGGGPGVMGLYKLFQGLIRTRYGRDLLTAAHEWSHAMQRSMQSPERGGKAFTDAAKAWMKTLPSDIRAEFDTILEGYGGYERLPPWRQAMEVWAEWHARELLSDTRLETEVPKLSNYFRTQLARPENAAIRDQFQRIQSKILQYQLIGARGRHSVSIESAEDIASESMRATQPTRFEQLRDKFLRNFFDDVIVLKRSTAKWLEAAKVDPAEIDLMEDPSRMWDALRMVAPKQTEQFVMRGVTTPEGRHVMGMRALMKSVKGRETAFREYLVAVSYAQRIQRRAVQRKRAVEAGERPPEEYRAPLSPAEYAFIVRDIQAANPDFRQTARDLKAWTDTIVDWVAGAGNLSQEQADRIKGAYVVWVPFFRLLEGAQAHARVGGRAVVPVREGVGKLKGGGAEPIQDPLMAMFDAVTSMISNAHRNMVVSALYKMSVGMEAGGIATKIKRTITAKDHPMAELLEAMERQVTFRDEGQFFFEDMISALKDADALDPQTVTLFAQKTIPVGEKNIIAFTPRLTEAEIKRTARGDEHLEQIIRGEQGKNQWLEIDPQIYEVLVGLDVPPMHKFFESGWLGQGLRVAAGARRLFATGIAPGFTAANMVRDALSQPLFTQDGKFAPGGGIIRMIKGAWAYHAEKGPNSIRELYDVMGVKISSFFHEGTRRAIIGESRGIIGKSRKAIEYLEEFFATPENYLRMNEFKQTYLRAKEAGKGEREARLLALEAGREITVNFARGGFVSRIINGMTPYFNASLQGQRKLWRQIVHGGEGRNDAERSRIQRASILNGVANITTPALILWWMNHEEEWYQDLPEWRKLLFFNMKISDDFILSLPKPFEAGVLFGGIPEAFMEAWVNENGTPPSLGTVMSDGLFPYLKGPGDFLPALFQPIIELASGWDFFRRRPLTPDWIASNRVPEDQATFYTSESAKVLSRVLNGAASPIEIEKIIGGYTAGTGTYALRMIDEITGMKNHPGFTMSPIQRFFVQPHRTGYYQNRMYRIGKLLDRRAGSRTATASELALRSRINRAKTRLSQIGRAVAAGTMDSVEAERLKFEISQPLVESYENIR